MGKPPDKPDDQAKNTVQGGDLGSGKMAEAAGKPVTPSTLDKCDSPPTLPSLFGPSHYLSEADALRLH